MVAHSDHEIRWRCRRGMLELDVLLSRFFDQHYQDLSQEQKQLFLKLLSEEDQDLFRWLVEGHSKNLDESQDEYHSIIQLILKS